MLIVGFTSRSTYVNGAGGPKGLQRVALVILQLAVVGLGFDLATAQHLGQRLTAFRGVAIDDAADAAALALNPLLEEIPQVLEGLLWAGVELKGRGWEHNNFTDLAEDVRVLLDDVEKEVVAVDRQRYSQRGGRQLQAGKDVVLHLSVGGGGQGLELGSWGRLGWNIKLYTPAP